MKYCTYITIYKGNKLPPFYIGHCLIEKLECGYLGTVSSHEYKNIWIEELKKRELFEVKIIRRFDDKATALEHEEYLQRTFQVHKNPMYINRAITNRHFFRKDFSDAAKKKLSNSAKNQFLDSIKRQRHLDGILRSNGNHKGKLWINNGKINKRVFQEQFLKEFPDWNHGRILTNKFYKHSNRRKHPITGRFLSKGEVIN